MIHVIILLPFRMCEHIISFIDRDPIVHISIRQRQPYYVPLSIIPNVTCEKKNVPSRWGIGIVGKSAWVVSKGKTFELSG